MATIDHEHRSPAYTMDSASYGGMARLLHWIVAGLVLLQTLIGWIMPDIDQNTPQEGFVALHLSVGVVLLVVVIIRVVWRATHPVLGARSLKPWEYWLASTVHGLIYALLVIIPLLGWAAAGYYGYTVRLFGLLKLPALADGTMDWAHAAGDIHAVLVNVLLAAIALHVAAALYHYFVRRDQVLQRMLPGV